MEGRDNYFALRKLFPKKILAIADQSQNLNLKGFIFIKPHLGKNYLKSLKNYDVILRSPGISLKKIKPFVKEKQIITTQTEIFFDNCPGTIIGITGTKGKGTTCSLLFHVLKKSGKPAKIIGNIEKPAFQELLGADKKDIFIYEISAQQLQGLKKSPHIAVFLNLFPAHFDYFGSFENYKKAKENITLYQNKNDYFLYNPKNIFLKKISEKTKAKAIPITTKPYKKIIKKTKLRGEYMFFNAATAIKTAEIMGISRKKIEKYLPSFKTMPHRMEFSGKYKGISFYDDSIATVPEATIAGIKSFGKELKTLIAGAMKIKGIKFKELAKAIFESNIENLILMPDTGKKIREEVLELCKKGSKKPLKIFFADSMEKAVKTAYKNSPKESACLLSPTAPSFNLFQNYKERGKAFKKAVKRFRKNENS